MSSRDDVGARILLFESSTHVFWAEEVAREEGIPVEVIPAPEGTGNHCGLAIQTLPSKLASLAKLLADEGIPFQELETG